MWKPFSLCSITALLILNVANDSARAQFSPDEEKEILSQASFGERLAKRILTHRDRLNTLGREFIVQTYGEENPEEIRTKSFQILDELSQTMLSISRSQNYLNVNELPRANAFRKLSSIFQVAAAHFIAEETAPVVPDGKDQIIRETNRITERTEILINAIGSYAAAVESLYSEWEIKSRKGQDHEGVFLFINDLDVIRNQLDRVLRVSDHGPHLEEINNVQRSSEFWLAVVPFLKSNIQKQKNSEKKDLSLQNQKLVLSLFLGEWINLNEFGAEVDPLAPVLASISRAFHDSRDLVLAAETESDTLRAKAIRLANSVRRNGTSFGNGEIYDDLTEIFIEISDHVDEINSQQVKDEARSEAVKNFAREMRASRSAQ